MLLRKTMQWFFLFCLLWFVICLPAIIYAAVIEGRRRKDARNFEDQIALLNRRFDGLQEQLKTATAKRAATPIPETPIPAVPIAVPVPVTTHPAEKTTVPEAAS
ncbi:MAG TPA: hypothetical protein VG759_00905, partial [Candidatus Angelobacter sp.]|nr:hypothetical protein [Candidatus Angelobacter sp.]